MTKNVRTMEPAVQQNSRAEGLSQLKRESRAHDDWPYGDKVACLMRISPGNPASGFSTPETIELRNGVVLDKHTGWTTTSRKAWNQLKDYRIRPSSPAVTEHKDLPGAKTLASLETEFPIEDSVDPVDPADPADPVDPEIQEDSEESLQATDPEPEMEPEPEPEPKKPQRQGGLSRSRRSKK